MLRRMLSRSPHLQCIADLLLCIARSAAANPRADLGDPEHQAQSNCGSATVRAAPAQLETALEDLA
jgi:hypothetical protein